MGRFLAEQTAERLRQNAIATTVSETPLTYGGKLPYSASEFELVCLCGGDGTLYSALPGILELGLPIWLIPAGGECLMARKLGMSGEPSQLLQALSERRFGRLKLASLNQQPFAIMSSVGVDADTIAILSRNRTSTLARWGYILPTLRASSAFDHPRLTIEVDGQRMIDQEPGFFILANCAEYAGGLKFVPEADLGGEKLSARFFPGVGVARNLAWFLNFITRRPVNLEGSQLLEGMEFLVRSDNPDTAVQVDGEYAGPLPMRISRLSAKLKFLLPVGVELGCLE